MNKWKVTMESEDSQIFVFETLIETKEEAIINAENRIIKLGWDNYHYKLKRVIPILKGKLQYAKERN